MKKSTRITWTTLGLISMYGIVLAPSIYIFAKGKTKDTQDQKIVNEINQIMETYIETYGDFSSMSELVDVLNTVGLDIEGLTATIENGQYVWDEQNDKVFIMDTNGEAAVAPAGYTLNPDKSKIWKMVKAGETSNVLLSAKNSNAYYETFKTESDYSQYLRSNSTITGELKFATNIDTGSIANLKLELVSKQEPEKISKPIVINTYGASLTVSSCSYTSIEHTGSLLDLNLNSLPSGEKFTTSGEIVGDVIMGDNAAGSFVAAEDSIVNTIFVANEHATVKVESKSVGTVVPTTNEAKAAINAIVDTTSIPEQDKPEIIDDKTIDPGQEELSGLGTVRSPYIITCKQDFAKIHDYYNQGYKYFEFASTEMEIDGSDWETNDYFGNLNGSFNGNGLVINNLSRPLFNVVGSGPDANDTYKISNVTLNCAICYETSTAGVVRTLAKNAIFENIEVHGYVSGGTYAGAFVGFGPGNFGVAGTHTINWQFVDCHSDAILTAVGNGKTEFTGAFVAYPFAELNGSSIIIKDSFFNGHMSTTAVLPEEGTVNSHWAYFTGGTVATKNMHVKTEYTEKTEFLLSGETPETLGFYTVPETKIDGWFYVGPKKPTDPEEQKNYVPEGYKYDGHREHITKVTGPTLTTEVQTVSAEVVEDAVYATAALYIGPNGKQETGNFVAPFVTEEWELTEGQTTITTNQVKNYMIRVNDAASGGEQGIHGDYFDVYDAGSFYGTTYGNAYILITQYRLEGNDVYVPIYVTLYNCPKS